MCKFLIAETRAVQEIGQTTRHYELVCVVSYHKNIKVGDIRKMDEDTILLMCHPVQLQHLPKITRNEK